VYLHFQDLETAVQYRLDQRLREAAQHRLLRLALRPDRPPSLSLRAGLAVALHALATWIDDRTRVDIAVPGQVLA
jgi:hypothetical protein